MRTFKIYTIGCKVNTFESESYRQELISQGLVETDIYDADIVIINTCTVTNSASFKSRQRIHQVKRMNPNAYLVVVGCYVQTESKMLLENYSIDLLIGAKDKDKLVNFVLNKSSSSLDLNFPNAFEKLSLYEAQTQTRAYIKIQDGCNQYCSYCIIPFTRGNERSLDEDSVIKQIIFLQMFHKEVVLTGIHTGRYGVNQNSTLSSLITRVLNETQIERIRLSSIEINEVSDELIALIKANSRVAHHLHISLQSGDNQILEDMHRPYTFEEFKRRVDSIRSEISDISISTDIIAGFPTETDDQFNNSFNNIKVIGFSFLHVFPYSKREMTQAALMKNTVSDGIKKDRVSILTNYSKQSIKNVFSQLLGQTLSVLIESQVEAGYFGYSSEYYPVLIQTEDILNHVIINCIVIGYNDERVIAVLKK